MKICSIASGSSGNCIYIGSERTHLLVDVGVSKKKVEAGLSYLGLTEDDITGILVTHEHSDHIGGVGVFSRAYQKPIFATKGTCEGISQYKNLGKMPENLYNQLKPDHKFLIGDIEVEAFTISHDALEPCGYIFTHKEKKVAVVTDLGAYNDYIVQKLKGLHAIYLEANHDVHMVEVGNYPYSLKQRVLSNKGHLSNELSGRLLCDILHSDLKYVILSHLSEENNFELLAYETVKMEVEMSSVAYSINDFELIIANRDGASQLLSI